MIISSLLSHFSKSVYFVMWWSVFNDHQSTMVLQTVLVINIVLIAHATPLGCSQIHASNVLEEPQVLQISGVPVYGRVFLTVTYAHTDTQTHRQTHTHTDTQTHRHTDTNIHTHAHRHTDTYTNIHTQIDRQTCCCFKYRGCVCMYVCVCLCVCVCARVRACVLTFSTPRERFFFSFGLAFTPPPPPELSVMFFTGRNV